ncbi:SdrD B-like domain-containing protein [Staphylococcus sp. 11261D007BR]
MKKNDFISNRLNKFSIRRFTVGTASILVGATLVFGISNDAKAAEEAGAENVNGQSTDSTDAGEALSTDEPATSETPNTDVENDSSLQPSAPVEEDKSVEPQSDEVDGEPSIETKEGTDSNVEPKSSEEVPTSESEVNTDPKPADNVNKDSNITKEEETQTTLPKEQASIGNDGVQSGTPEIKDPSPENASQAESTTQLPPSSPQATSNEDTSAKQITPKKPVENPEASKQEAQVLSPEKDTTSSTLKDDANLTLENSEVNNNVDSSNINENTKATVKKFLEQNSSLSAGEIEETINSVDIEDADSLIEILQDFTNQKDSETPEATPTVFRNALSNEESISLTGNDVKNLQLAGSNKDVSNLMQISNIDIEITPGHTNPNTGNLEFWATSGDALKLKADYQLDDEITEGDQFTIQYGKNYRPGALNTARDTHTLYSNDGKIIAQGVYDAETKTTTYTFTNYVDQYQNITGSFVITTFSDRYHATDDKTAYPMEVNIAGQQYSEDIIVDYGNKSHKDDPIVGSTEYIEVQSKDRHMNVYINQPGRVYQNSKLTVDLVGFKFDGQTDDFKIYKVTDDSQFVDSFAPDTSQLQDVTDQFNVNYTNDHQAIIDFGSSLSNGEKFIVQHVAHTDKNFESDKGQINYNWNAYDLYSGVPVDFPHENSYNLFGQGSTGSGNNPVYKLGDYVWEDVDRDGQQGTDENEKPIPGVAVILKDADGRELDRVTTDEQGKYVFENLQNGTYQVEFVPPEGYEMTPANADGVADDVDSDGLNVTAVIDGADNMTVDSGFYKPTPTYKLGDYVWEDVDKDGVQGTDTNEQPIEGVTVILKDKDGNELNRTTTNAEGYYEFDGLENGDYTVEFVAPEGYVETPVDQGEDDSKDSDAGIVDVTIQDADDMTIDKGYYKPAPTYKLGDYVWEDVDKDGVQGTDTNEQPIEGVTVILKDKDGNELNRTTTNAEGYYEFDGLENGDYTVEFVAPEGYVETPVDQGEDDSKDSDAGIVNVTIQDADDMTIDKGFYKPTYKLGDYVWEDVDKDGIQGTDENEKPIKDVTVILKDKDGNEINRTTTDEKGYYEFTGLENGDYTVEFETPEGYEETPVNQGGNNEKDSNESTVKVTINGKDDVTIDKGFYKPTYKIGDYVWEDVDKDGIQGTDENEKPIKDVTVILKDKDGNEINRTTTDEKGYYEFTGLENGDYTVEFETPEGYEETPVNQGGNNEKDSNEGTVKITINGKDDVTIDKGFYKPTYKIGDYVWEDVDKDGIQGTDENEKPIKDVTVILKDKDGNEINRTTTDEKGYYEFTGLENGDYTVEFETPEGYEETPVNQGGNNEKDSNEGTVKVTINGKDDVTIDKGFYKPTYKIGDYVWEDVDKDGIQGTDENEKPIKDVTVILKDKDGNEINRTTTDEKGYYEFTDLENGDYTVEFETPEGYEETPTGQGTDKGKDSNEKVVNVTINGKDDVTIDKGFYKPTYKLGDYVWEDVDQDVSKVQMLMKNQCQVSL